MKKIFDLLVKPSRLILIIAAFAYAGLYSIVHFAGIGGGFLPVVADLLIITLTLIAVVAGPILLLLKKEEAAKLVFLLVAAYWLLSSVLGYLSYAYRVVEGAEALDILIGIFGFLAGLALTGVLVLLILNFILKKEVFKFSAVLAFVGAIAFILIAFILLFVYYIVKDVEWAKNDWGTPYNWISFVSLFLMLAAPVAILFGYLYFLGAPEYDLPKRAPKEKKPEPVKESGEEAPAEEPAPEEEKPAE